jgi:ammonia channel protein AmtB
MPSESLEETMTTARSSYYSPVAFGRWIIRLHHHDSSPLLTAITAVIGAFVGLVWFVAAIFVFYCGDTDKAFETCDRWMTEANLRRYIASMNPLEKLLHVAVAIAFAASAVAIVLGQASHPGKLIGFSVCLVMFTFAALLLIYDQHRRNFNPTPANAGRKEVA